MDVEKLAKELILKNMTSEQQMAVLEGIKSTVAEAKEVQKRKIGENVDIVVQALKKIEADIRSRYDDVGNAIEKRVASIKDGRDGKDGKDGRDGKDGKAGRDGAKGDKGDAGRDGRDGVDGIDGVSVTSARIDLMVALSSYSLAVLNSMLVRLLLLTLQNASKSLLMVAALLSLFLIL